MSAPGPEAPHGIQAGVLRAGSLYSAEFIGCAVHPARPCGLPWRVRGLAVRSGRDRTPV